MIIKNPTLACRKTVTILSEGYTRTCHSDTCCCVSHDPGYKWVEIPDEQANLVTVVRSDYPGSHNFTRSRFEHDIIVKKELAEKLRQEKISKQKWIEEKKAEIKKAYGEKWLDVLWRKKIPFLTEPEVIAAVKELTGEKRQVHRGCMDVRSTSSLRKQHFPKLTGSRFESALQIADVLLLLSK